MSAPSTTSAASDATIRPSMAISTSATDAVSPMVNVLVAAATLAGKRITSLESGVFKNPPPTPASPVTTPATAMRLTPSFIRDGVYGTTL